MTVIRPVVCLLVATAVVASCSEAASAPDIDVEAEALLTVEAIRHACSECDHNDHLFVRDQRFGATTLIGNEADMPETVQAEILDAYPAATFVSRDEADELFVDGVVVGGGFIVSVDEPEQLTDDVVGIAVMVTTARDGALGQVIQFQWNGSGWQFATSSETGVTQTTVVS